MSKARAFVLGAVVLVLAVSPTAVPQEPSVVAAQVTVDYAAGAESFSGVVSSTELEGYNEAGCVGRRHVVIKRVRKGRDKSVNRDLTNSEGRFRIPYLLANGGPQKAGRFYAEVVRKVLVSEDDGSEARCEPATSGRIRVTEP